MKTDLLCALLLALSTTGIECLSCGECNRDNLTEICGPAPSCNETVLDACGCCPLCAKAESEACGGPWDSLGTCGKGLLCRPVSTDAPVLGAGGIYSESWDPAGICINPHKYQQEHSPCLKQLAAYHDFQNSRSRRHAVVDGKLTSSVDDRDVPLTTMPVTSVGAVTDGMKVETEGVTESRTDVTQSLTDTTVACLRKPSCTPDGYFTPLQCDGCAGECWCSFHDGQEVQETRGPFHTVRC